jgi:hypothetical protein
MGILIYMQNRVEWSEMVLVQRTLAQLSMAQLAR